MQRKRSGAVRRVVATARRARGLRRSRQLDARCSKSGGLRREGGSGSVRVEPDAPTWVRQKDAAVNRDYAIVIAEATALISNAILNEEPDLRKRPTTLDSDVKELLRHVGLGVMAAVFRSLAEALTAESESKGLKVNRRKRIAYSVVFGAVEVESPYLWDPKTKQSARPVKDALGLRTSRR